VPVPLLEGEIFLKSLKIVENKYIYGIQDGILAFENYLKGEFGPEVQFNYVTFTFQFTKT
jgi:hypothetical protein